jgi:hypothetical protein
MEREEVVIAFGWRGSISKIFVFIVFIVISTRAFSSEWVDVGSIGKSAGVMVDKQSISQSSKSTRKAWVLFAFTEMKTQKTSPYSQYDTTKELWIANCSSLEIGTKSMVWMRDGLVVDSYNTKNVNFDDIVPDSIGEIIHKYICRSKIK